MIMVIVSLLYCYIVQYLQAIHVGVLIANMKESFEHFLQLKVMRLTTPPLVSTQIVTGDSSDEYGILFNDIQKRSVTSVPGADTLMPSTLLVLPQRFGNIYLGEMFNCYICVNNASPYIVENVTFQVQLQTRTRIFEISTQPIGSTAIVAAHLDPGDIVERLINQDIQELGRHILVFEINYVGDGQQHTLEKFFKFEVLKPFEVKTKLYTTEADEILLEVQVQNITTDIFILEKIVLESWDFFSITKMNTSQCIGGIDLSPTIRPSECLQFLYRLTPIINEHINAKLLSKVTSIGKLGIVWRTEFGGRGHVQTTQLHRVPLDFDQLHLIIDKLPAIVSIEERFDFTLCLTNISARDLDVIMYLDNTNDNFTWCSSCESIKFGILRPNNCIKITLGMIPLCAGLLSITGITIEDINFNQKFEFHNIACVYVTRKV